MEVQLINKEEIPQYKITQASDDKSQEWRDKLSYAVRLGNEFKGKTNITFQTEDGIKTVETTIWTLTESYISLKGGINIPLKSIIDIRY